MLKKEHLKLLISPFDLSVAKAEFVQCRQNYVYRHQAADRTCIIRISKGRYRSRKQIEAELLWIRYLVGRGIKACLPIPTIEGSPCHEVEIEGETYIVVCFEHAPGTQTKRQDADESMFEKLGRLVGQLHAITASSSQNPDNNLLDRPQWYQSRFLVEDFADQREVISDAFQASVGQMIHGLKQAPKTSDNFGLIHGDINFLNFFENKGEFWLFDFDNSEYAFFIQDLAVILYDSIYFKVFNNFEHDGLNDRMKPYWTALLKGYLQTSPLKEIDLSQLKTLFLLREAVIYVHSNRVFGPEHKDKLFHYGQGIMRRNIENQEPSVDIEFITKN